MSLLAALTRAYDRLPDAPSYGFSTEKIGFCVVLNPDGSVAEVVDLRDHSSKRPTAKSLVVPATPKRSGSTPRPNFLWDNANYALGAGKISDSNDTRYDAFRDKHLEYLAAASAPEITAFCAFLRTWEPARIVDYFPEDNLPTEGIVFAHSDNYRETLLHEVAEAVDFWNENRARWTTIDGKATSPAVCLVYGKMSPIARTHPPIKGMSGVGGKSEMALVSFNDDAYESYGHEQGDNAPVSEAAAFAYTTALNRFLEKDSGHRIQIGDASTVFWADTSDAEALEAESLFSAFFDPDTEDKLATSTIGARLEEIRSGKSLAEVAPDLNQGVRFHVLGLAPNAARLSVRFYWESDFGQLTANYQRYVADTAIDPPPREGWPPMWRYLRELAVLGKSENVPPNLAGDWMRAILTGTPYPMTLLSTALMRMRSDGEINALRAAIVKSVLIRNLNVEVPVALDLANTNKGYVLGRLFAVYEEVQRAALGGNVNATIKDKFYGSASATPQKVFAALSSGSQNHFSKLKKQSPGRAVNLEKLLMTITDLMAPGDDPIPVSLASNEQALFGIGYYHQRSDFLRKHHDSEPNVTESAQ
jgi:CRISPR-associated protein Csd1